MSKQSIGTGSTPNDGTGDTLRVAFGKINANFTEVYPHQETRDPTVNDDSDSSFPVGQLWMNTSTVALFICFDNTVGAAVWKEISFV